MRSCPINLFGGSSGSVATFTISPSSGSVAGGTLVTITGASLSGASGVTIGGAAATSLSRLSSTQITVLSPAGALGAKDVVVTVQTTSAGITTTSTQTLSGGFTYVAAPWPSTSTLSTVAGTGAVASTGDGGAATAAAVDSPVGGATDSDGNFYFVDGGSRVRVIAKKTGTRLGVALTAGNIYTVAGNGTAGFAGDTAAAVAAQIDAPQGLAVDFEGNLFIADGTNHRIRMVANVTGTRFSVAMTAGNIYTIAGSASSGFAGDGALATGATLNGPFGVAVDSVGNVYIADTGNSRVRMVPRADGTYFGVVTAATNIYTLVGTVTAGVSADGTPGTSASLDTPVALALDSNDNLFIADKADNSLGAYGAFVQVLAKSGGTVLGIAVTADQVFAVAGKDPAGTSSEAIAATSASLGKPYSIAVDAAGNLFMLDFLNHRVRAVAQSNLTRIGVAMTTGKIYTVVGTGTPGFSGDGGSPTAAEIDSPNGVALDSGGKLFVADKGNSRIRAATP